MRFRSPSVGVPGSHGELPRGFVVFPLPHSIPTTRPSTRSTVARHARPRPCALLLPLRLHHGFSEPAVGSACCRGVHGVVQSLLWRRLFELSLLTLLHPHPLALPLCRHCMTRAPPSPTRCFSTFPLTVSPRAASSWACTARRCVRAADSAKPSGKGLLGLIPLRRGLTAVRISARGGVHRACAFPVSCRCPRPWRTSGRCARARRVWATRARPCTTRAPRCGELTGTGTGTSTPTFTTHRHHPLSFVV